MVSRRRVLLSVLAAAWVSMQAVAVWAQDKSAAPPPVQQKMTIGLGDQYQSIAGNERRFDQYVTPPSELYLSRAIWQRLDPSGGLNFALDLRDLGEPDPSGYLWMYGAGMNLDSQYRRSTYYADFTPVSGRSRRRDYFVNLGSQAAPYRTYSWQAGTNEVAVVGDPAAGAVDFQDRNNHLNFGTRTGAYWLNLGYNREQFNVRTGDGLTGNTDTYSLGFSPTLWEKTQISGNFTRNITNLDGFDTQVRSWNAVLTMLRPVNEDLIVTGQLRRFRIDRTITQNAYAQQQSSGRLEADYSVRPGTTLDACWTNSITDYVDGRQQHTVDVEANTLALQVRSRLSRSLKVNGKFRRYDVANRPLYYKIDGQFGDSLIYSTLKRWDLGASYAPGAVWGLSGHLQRQTWNNDAQDLGNSLNTTSLTGWWQVRSNLSTTASYVRQDFDLPLQDVATSLGYASRATSVVLGANYLLTPRDTIYASYADAVARGATSDDFRHFTLGITHDTAHGDHFLAEMNLGNFSDDFDDSLNYDADLYRLEWQHDL